MIKPELIDLIEPLSRYYGPKAIYPTAKQILEPETNGVRQAVCFYQVSPLHTTRSPDLTNINGSIVGENNMLTGNLLIFPAYAIDHFIQASVFPGHKQIRAALAYAVQAGGLLNNFSFDITRARLFGFESVSFDAIVRPKDLLQISRVNLGAQPKLNILDIEIKRKNEVTANIKGMEIGVEPSQDGVLLEDQLIEAMIQSAAATALDLGQTEGIPLFQSIGRTRFYGKVPNGTIVKMVASTTSDKRGFRGNVVAVVDGRKIAESSDMKALILSNRLAEKLLGIRTN